ncbi:MAG: hypothetical protein LBN27_03605 [Prevotellaceae bacterium]|jgi:hypothetical protein|nr:hypothetical protein [Prevotellaceae bacterium]
MELYGDILCLTGEEMTSVIPTGTFKSWINRGKITNLRQRACYGMPALYNPDCVPAVKQTDYKEILYRAFPALSQFKQKSEEERKMSILEENIFPDPQANDWYSNYRKPNGDLLEDKQRREYYTNAIILNACKLTWERSLSYRVGKKSMKKCDFWKNMKLAIENLSADKYPHSLYLSWEKLMYKAETYYTEIDDPARGKIRNYSSLLNGRMGNKNRTKIKASEQEAMLVKLGGDRRNLDNEQIRMLYNVVADTMGWEQISAGTVANWRKKYDLETSAGRRGMTHYRNTREMQNKRQRPSAPMLFWSADGWDVELFYQKTAENAKGHSVTTYNNRLTVVTVLDAFNNYPIGYAIGDHETPELITEALRNAVNHTQELFGARYKAYQFQSDHYAIKKLTPAYEQISKHVTPARVKNAKAKPVEPYFGTINKKYCQLMPNWSGFGVTSSKELQPNVDALNMFRKNFPDYEGCVAQVVFIIEKERAEKRAAYVENWQKLSQEYKLPLTKEMYLLTFGEETGYTNTLEASGLRPTIRGQKCSYDSFDLNFRRNSNVRWAVKYDPNDLSEVLAVSEDGTKRFLLEEKYIQPMALADRKAGDGEQLARVNEYNRNLERHVTQVMCDADNVVAELFNNAPQLRQYNDLQKLVMPDSKGQHKDRRNEARLEPRTKMQEPRQLPQWKAANIQTVEVEDMDLVELY